MSSSPEHSYETLEIIDSGHKAATDSTTENTEELWATVKNSGEGVTVTVKLRLQNEKEVLASHTRTNKIPADETQSFRFVVSVPPGFDQYVFTITNRENE